LAGRRIEGSPLGVRPGDHVRVDLGAGERIPIPSEDQPGGGALGVRARKCARKSAEITHELPSDGPLHHREQEEAPAMHLIIRYR
jgi:hypothetical protein